MTLERRTPMRRGAPLPRGVSLRRTGSLRRSGGLARTGGPAPRSAARQRQMSEERVPAVVEAVMSGRRCELGPVLQAAGLDPGCVGRIGGFHERRKSSAGGSRSNPANLLAACNRCNGWIEDHPFVVRAATGDALVVREGDPEWTALGRRADREPCATCGGAGLVNVDAEPGDPALLVDMACPTCG